MLRVRKESVMSKFYPTWLEAWKDVTHQYEEYDPPIAKEEKKEESDGKKVQTGKRSKRTAKVSD